MLRHYSSGRAATRLEARGHWLLLGSVALLAACAEDSQNNMVAQGAGSSSASTMQPGQVTGSGTGAPTGTGTTQGTASAGSTQTAQSTSNPPPPASTSTGTTTATTPPATDDVATDEDATTDDSSADDTSDDAFADDADDSTVDDTPDDTQADDTSTDDLPLDDSATDDSAVDDNTTDDAPPEPGSDCNNDMQDGDEGGTDCGGGCSTECVAYEIEKPNPENEDRSGCEANGNGFMCPRAMAFSPQMTQAALDDWGGPEAPFVYGVVGHDPDPGGVDGASASYSSTCCQCYQLVFKHPSDGAVSVPAPKPMIVQAFNTYAGGPTAFDVYMAVGGHGNFNGCTENGRLYSSYPDTGGDWSGGVRATRYDQCRSDMGYDESSLASDNCQGFIESECNKITANEPIQSIARQSCVESNRVDTHYHNNWEVMAQRVECPVALTRVTGCQLGSQGLPAADPAIQTQGDAQAAGFRDGYHTTTMEDCCRPTCAWPTNVEGTTDGWSRFYVCDQDGNID